MIFLKKSIKNFKKFLLCDNITEKGRKEIYNKVKIRKGD